MITTATIMARDKTTVWVRVPELHPHRILTLPAGLLPGERGDVVRVEARSGIEATTAGWSALIVPA